mgnify:CR=1 FL=1
MKFKGINYNAGIDYNQCGEGSEINPKEFLSDLKWIKKMNCNSIRLYGSHNQKLLKYTKLALQNGFIVWTSPRYIGTNKHETLSLLLDFSKQLEKTRRNDNLFLIIGNEFTIDMQGLVAGNTQMQRAMNYKNAKSNALNIILSKFVPEIRKVFGGKITYASLITENIDYSLFDYIGLNYYWYFGNMLNYASRLKNLSKKYEKKIIITEFGTCCYKFASFLDGAAYYPIQQLKLHEKPILKWMIIRDEKEQIKYLKRCFKNFEEVNVEGAFIFDYAEKWKTFIPHKRCMDLASFGIMKNHENGKIIPKLAFNYVREHYNNK